MGSQPPRFGPRCGGLRVRADSSRELAEQDGFDTKDLASANEADVICVLIPDDVIPTLELSPRPDALVVVASGYTLAFGRLDPTCDVGMVAPRMLGPEVRQCYLEGVGFITAVGVQRDETKTARARVLAVALAYRRASSGGDRDVPCPRGDPRPRSRAGSRPGRSSGSASPSFR